MSHAPNLCHGCQHLQPTPLPSPTALTLPDLIWHESHQPCAAFPNGIPTQILDGSVDHRTPFPGDHGIQYDEMLTGTAASYDTYKQLISQDQLARRRARKK